MGKSWQLWAGTLRHCALKLAKTTTPAPSLTMLDNPVSLELVTLASEPLRVSRVPQPSGRTDTFRLLCP